MEIYKKKLVSSLKVILSPNFFCLKNLFQNMFFKAHKKCSFFDLPIPELEEQ